MTVTAIDEQGLNSAPVSLAVTVAPKPVAPVVAQPTISVEALDTRLEILLKTLNVKKPNWLNIEGAKNAKQWASDHLSSDDKKIFRDQVDDLERQYRSGGFLDKQDRKSYLDKIRVSINNWG